MPLDPYLETKVLTARPDQLHLLVLEGAMRWARQAESALTAGDHNAALRALETSREFVGELLAGLNRDQAPDLVDQLQALFLFVFRNLAAAEIHRDPQPVRQALKVLEIHRQSWLQLTEQLRTRPAAATPTSEDAPARSWEA